MRRLFENFTIPWKLALITAVAIVATLIAAGSLFSVYETGIYQREEAQKATAIARVLSGGLVLAGTYRDSKATQQFLDAMIADPEFDALAGYDDQGNVRLKYGRPGAPRPDYPETPGPEGFHVEGNTLTLFTPAVGNSDIVRTIFVRLHIDSERARLTRYLAGLLAIGIGVLIVVMPISLRLHGMVSDPLEESRRAAENKLRDVQGHLVHVSRLSDIGQMASSIAHELNQPLAAVSNYVSAAQRFLTPVQGPEAEQARYAMARASEQAIRTAEVVRRVRAFAARGDLEQSNEDIGEVIEEAIALACGAIRMNDVTLRRNFRARDSMVAIDRIQIQQVLLNLIRNAVEAMDGRAKPEITVSTSDRGDRVEVAVSDNGPGFAPEALARLFQPFVTTKKAGMGVGLSICRTIVEAHGGTLTVDGDSEGGATFRFSLAKASATAAGETSAAAQ